MMLQLEGRRDKLEHLAVRLVNCGWVNDLEADLLRSDLRSVAGREVPFAQSELADRRLISTERTLSVALITGLNPRITSLF